ncbi:MAG: hypothetical protein ABIH92_04460 [Nanoarchaeota archaeon]
MVKKRVYLFGLLFIIISVSLASAADFNHVIANSENWKDVYSVMHYASLEGVGKDFLVSTRHGPILLNGINKKNDILVVSSRSVPFVINYDDMVGDRGFSSAEGLIVRDANLELIDELPEIKNFVVVSDTYGYNAIAAAPYAVVNNAWVFLVDRTNVDDIDVILSDRGVDELLIYGFVEREVRDTLEKYDPEIIDTGDRFEDNTRIVDKYLEIKPVQQVLLTNGEFIEREIMSGMNPVLFTGKENVPDKISDYLKSSDIEVGVLVGSDLVGAATNIRRSTGISVIVKFARGARNPTGAIAAVENLDLFYLPIPIVELSLHSAKYNRATSQLELTYKSESNIPVFFKGTITPISDSGERTRVGDAEPVFIAPNDFKTVAYPGVDFSGESLSVEVFTLYGDTPSSLEKILERTIDVEIVNVVDRCEIDVEGVKYSKPKESFIIKVKNIGSIDCWVDVELSDVIIDGIETTLGSEGSIKIKAGKSGKVVIEQEMSDEDLEENDFVDVIAYYGEREDGLIKVFQGRFELKIEIISLATIGLVALVLVIIIVIIFLLIAWRKRKEEDF